MEERIEINDRRGLKRQADINKSDSVRSENIFHKSEQVDDDKKGVIKRLKSSSASPKQGTI